jgi:hypothetical protein
MISNINSGNKLIMDVEKEKNKVVVGVDLVQELQEGCGEKKKVEGVIEIKKDLVQEQEAVGENKRKFSELEEKKNETEEKKRKIENIDYSLLSSWSLILSNKGAMNFIEKGIIPNSVSFLDEEDLKGLTKDLDFNEKIVVNKLVQRLKKELARKFTYVIPLLKTNNEKKVKKINFVQEMDWFIRAEKIINWKELVRAQIPASMSGLVDECGSVYDMKKLKNIVFFDNEEENFIKEFIELEILEGEKLSTFNSRFEVLFNFSECEVKFGIEKYKLCLPFWLQKKIVEKKLRIVKLDDIKKVVIELVDNDMEVMLRQKKKCFRCGSSQHLFSQCNSVKVQKNVNYFIEKLDLKLDAGPNPMLIKLLVNGSKERNNEVEIKAVVDSGSGNSYINRVSMKKLRKNEEVEVKEVGSGINTVYFANGDFENVILTGIFFRRGVNEL